MKFVFREYAPRQWIVEALDETGWLNHPYAVAWLLDYSAVNGLDVVLTYVLVCDEYRKRGIGKALIMACFEKWPNLILTDPISEGGEALIASIEREREKTR